jgi:hypothetical protein
MKRYLIGVVMLMSLSSVAIMAVGQEPSPPQEQPRADAAESISGIVKSLDTATNQITVMTADQKEVVFTIDAKTKVTKGDQPSSASELKQGQQVKAKVQDSRAISISISS